MIQENYQVKKISFEDFEKYFKELIDSPDSPPIVFYKQDSEKICISFSFDSFIIITEIKISKIIEMYEDDKFNSLDVVSSDSPEHPALIKFKNHYLERGIPEL